MPTTLDGYLNSTGVTQTGVSGGTTNAAGGDTKITILGKEWTIPLSWIDGFSEAQVKAVTDYLSTNSGFKVFFDGSKNDPNTALSIISLIMTKYRQANNIPFATMQDPGLSPENTTNSTQEVLEDLKNGLLSIPSVVSDTLGLDNFLYIGLIVLAIIILK
jgi:hypothetical protein